MREGKNSKAGAKTPRRRNGGESDALCASGEPKLAPTPSLPLTRPLRGRPLPGLRRGEVYGRATRVRSPRPASARGEGEGEGPWRSFRSEGTEDTEAGREREEFPNPDPNPFFILLRLRALCDLCGEKFRDSRRYMQKATWLAPMTLAPSPHSMGRGKRYAICAPSPAC